MIVIPMAGRSRRFAEAGYFKPKYMLPLPGGSVFLHAVNSFRAYFETEKFLFIARVVEDTEAFIRSECAALGLSHVEIRMLDDVTGGQAETVELGLQGNSTSNLEPLTIFNIDTFRPGFAFPTPSVQENSDGYLEVFKGSGPNWSYVRPDNLISNVVVETAEKRPISDLCCTGLYHFARSEDFRIALAAERKKTTLPELYVAPLYNHLIGLGRKIHYDLIESSAVIFCGVPAEYEALL